MLKQSTLIPQPFIDEEQLLSPQKKIAWQSLQIFSLYRFLIATAILEVFKTKTVPSFLGSENDLLFLGIANIYFSLSVLFLLCAIFKRPTFEYQANLSIFSDIFSIVLLAYASGGVQSGISILLIVITAAHSLLIPGKLSLFGAAVAILGILLTETYLDLIHNFTLETYSQAGMLGAAIFTTSLVTNLLAIKSRKNHLLAKQHSIELARLQQLNAYVVARMQSGVLVLNNKNDISLINDAAINFLELPSNKLPKTLSGLPEKLQLAIKNWNKEKLTQQPFQTTPQTPSIRIVCQNLGDSSPLGRVIFLYDVEKETQQAQNMKLASLGHLAANIAHEIRNPLGAASHAAQLLEESTYLTSQDKKLISIIEQHCKRMNTIIENVFNLSSRKKPLFETIDLNEWLKTFVAEFKSTEFNQVKIKLTTTVKDVKIYIDPSQLRQILLNLCENGLRYSMKKTGIARLQLDVSDNLDKEQIYLDIVDFGNGINEQKANQLFEPFFTTEKMGSGLGLYIAKELCQANGARINYFPAETGGCKFRITFIDREGV